MSINHIVREGNLTKDVVYFAGDGDKKKSFASMRVASYGGKNGDEQLSLYATVKCYGYLADQVKDLKKGDAVVFSGRVVADSYDKDGVKVETEAVIAADITYRKRGEATDSSTDEKPKTKKTKPKADPDQSDTVPF